MAPSPGVFDAPLIDVQRFRTLALPSTFNLIVNMFPITQLRNTHHGAAQFR